MNEELVQFAAAVRESTLKRLNLVPMGAENWRVDPEAMSFSDTAQHLIDSDLWLYATLRAKTSIQMLGKAGIANVTDRIQYDELLNKLARSGDQRATLLLSLNLEALRESVDVPEFGGAVSTWWAIVRGNIDHEIHHRGQIAAYLRALKAVRPWASKHCRPTSGANELSAFIPGNEFVVHETEHWRINQRVDSTLPGYLMVGAKEPKAVDLAHLSEGALSEMGAVLRRVTGALQQLFQPEHLHICRFGHDSGHSVHFHVIPIYNWVKVAYHRAAREGGTRVPYPDFADGASLTLFVTEEFGRGRAPCEIVEPSIPAVIDALRQELCTERQPNENLQPPIRAPR